MDLNNTVYVRHLGKQPYEPVWLAMKNFTEQRDECTPDEIWFVEHEAVFTQGQAGKAEHLLYPGDIPVVHVDRGGQVTYHGPGQQVVYLMINLKRKKLGVRQLVTAIEQSIVDLAAEYSIKAAPRTDAPGVYVDGKKLCSLGLRIRKGCSFHGLALNVNMDLEPFARINPCGLKGMEMIQLADIGGVKGLTEVERPLQRLLLKNLGYRQLMNDDDRAQFNYPDYPFSAVEKHLEH